MYLHLSSDDRAFAANIPWDFVVNLPTHVALEQGNWKIALVDIAIDNLMRVREDLFVFCDVVEHETFAIKAFRPLLNVVRKLGPIERPHFLTVATESLHRIRVYIRDKNMSIPTRRVSAVRCTLQLKRK